MEAVQTLGELLARPVAPQSGLRYLGTGDREDRITVAGLFDRARGLLGHLRRQGLRPGDPLVLFVRNNAAFVDAFWACQLGGLVPVPLSAGVTAEPLRKLQKVLSALKRPALLVERETWLRFVRRVPEHDLAADRLCLLEDVTGLEPDDRLHASSPDDTALIQFSSGSTGEPRGVMLTHRNLLANMRAIIAAADIGQGDSTLSWMPLSHDMGLIGFHLVPMLRGIDQTIMETDLFVRRPARWLQAATEYRATLLCAPNFGYQHYLARVADDKGVDLRAVRLVFNGAEPVSASVCRSFAARLEPAGLDGGTLFPVYGLAEASLAVTFPEPGSGLRTLRVAADSLVVGQAVQRIQDPAGIELVCLGEPVESCELQIRDREGATLGGERVGHVWIRGSSVTRGYYRADAASLTLSTDGWLDTGDLGFIGPGGLYITGRSKDVIFVAGQNRYPQDLEWLLQRHAGLESGKVAVTAVRSDEEGEDRILVFVQHRRGPEEFLALARQVEQTLAEATGLGVSAVVPVRSLPRTTSGKLQRYRLAQAWEAGDYLEAMQQLRALAPAGEDPSPASDVEQVLLELCRQLFPGHAIEPRQNLFELGADSLMLVRIHEEIETRFPGRVEITDLFDYPDIRSLAGWIEKCSGTTRTE